MPNWPCGQPIPEELEAVLDAWVQDAWQDLLAYADAHPFEDEDEEGDADSVTGLEGLDYEPDAKPPVLRLEAIVLHDGGYASTVPVRLTLSLAPGGALVVQDAVLGPGEATVTTGQYLHVERVELEADAAGRDADY